MRCGDSTSRGDRGVLVDDLLDDRADRLVDQRDPELVVLGHRRELWLLSAGSPRDLRRCEDQQHREELSENVLGQRFCDLGAHRPSPRSRRRRSRRRRATARCRSDSGRQTPTSTVGMIARRDVASACSCVRPSHVSVGTNRMPPPTPNSPARPPASEAEQDRKRICHWSSIRIAIATRSAAKRSDSVRTGTRCCKRRAARSSDGGRNPDEEGVHRLEPHRARRR